MGNDDSNMKTKDFIERILLDSGVVNESLIQTLKKMGTYDEAMPLETMYEIVEKTVKESIGNWQKKNYNSDFNIAVSMGEIGLYRFSRDSKSPKEYIESLSKEDYNAFLDFLKGKGVDDGNASTISISAEGVLEVISESRALTKRIFIKPNDNGNIRASMQELATLQKDDYVIKEDSSARTNNVSMVHYVPKEEFTTMQDINHTLKRMIYDKEGKLINGDIVDYWSYSGIPTFIKKYNKESGEWELLDVPDDRVSEKKDSVVQRVMQRVNRAFYGDADYPYRQLSEYRGTRANGYEILKREEPFIQRAIRGFRRLTGGEAYKSEELQRLLEYRREKGKDYVKSFVSPNTTRSENSDIGYPDL